VTDNIVFTIVTFTRTTRLPTRFAVSVTVPRTNAIAAIDDDNVIAGGARPWSLPPQSVVTVCKLVVTGRLPGTASS
jgi:hypothetical protein